MSMKVQEFCQRLFHEHDSASIWYLVRDSFMSMIVRVFGQRLFYKHDSANIWSETLS